jgi:hypothetical protein
MQKRNKDGTWGSSYDQTVAKEIDDMKKRGLIDHQIVGFLIGVYGITERTAKRWLERSKN